VNLGLADYVVFGYILDFDHISSPLLSAVD
jgi:hypothetical protein